MNGKFIAALAVVWIFATGAAAPDKMVPVKVTDGVYMMEHSRGSGNSTIVVTDDGVLVFDFHIDNADQTLAEIRRLTEKKIKYLITSHSAGDHASGAWHFREDAPVWIATKNQAHDLQMQEREEFIERKNSKDPRYAAYQKGEPLTPTIAVDGPMTLYFGGLTFQITPEGRGHSTGDLTVYIPQKRVMLMGDLLDTEIHPGQGESAGVFFSNVSGWIKILDNINGAPARRRDLCSRSWSGAHRSGRCRSRRAEALFRRDEKRSGEDGSCGQDPGADRERIQSSSGVYSL
jgi:glyoxylase-like metal-dependent hydrolase (beta-lactamase superfamily II)